MKKYKRIIHLRNKDNPPTYNPLMSQNETKPTSSGLDPSKILDNSPYLPASAQITFRSFSLEILDNSKNPTTFLPSVHKRGEIKEFSRKSKRRMMLKLSKFNYDYYETKLFLTCTFRNIFPTSKTETKQYLLSLIKRIERIDKDVALVWRVEKQKRGAPHFHFILCFPKFYNGKEKRELSKKLKNAWGDLTHHINKYAYTLASDVRELNSNIKTFNYISKYSSKVDDENAQYRLGRIWGIRGNVKEFDEIQFEVSQYFADELKRMIFNELNTHIKVSREYENYIFTYDLVKLIIPYEKILLFMKATADITGEHGYKKYLYRQASLFDESNDSDKYFDEHSDASTLCNPKTYNINSWLS
ncbi:MAG: hypothetical protein J5I57_08270 [Melioribacteraceae bacterium]|nr:hypothetical protein [Melioribacteraceae bacterium]